VRREKSKPEKIEMTIAPKKRGRPLKAAAAAPKEPKPTATPKKQGRKANGQAGAVTAKGKPVQRTKTPKKIRDRTHKVSA